MGKVSVYNTEYTKLNHAYIEIYDFYTKLVACDDADSEVVTILGSILQVFNPTLDKIKSEMTVKTRYKDDALSQKTPNGSNGAENTKSPYILTGNFTGE